jgi:hypothetical protein
LIFGAFKLCLTSVTGQRHHFDVVEKMVMGLKGEAYRAAAKSKFLYPKPNATTPALCSTLGTEKILSSRHSILPLESIK